MAPAVDKVDAAATDRQEAMEFASVRQSIDEPCDVSVRARAGGGGWRSPFTAPGSASPPASSKVLDPLSGAFETV